MTERERWMDRKHNKKTKGSDDESLEENKRWMCLQMADGHAQQQGSDQHDGAGGQGACTVVVVVPMAVAPVGPVAVVPKTTLHLGSGVAAVSLVAESLVSARLHHSV